MLAKQHRRKRSDINSDLNWKVLARRQIPAWVRGTGSGATAGNKYAIKHVGKGIETTTPYSVRNRTGWIIWDQVGGGIAIVRLLFVLAMEWRWRFLPWLEQEPFWYKSNERKRIRWRKFWKWSKLLFVLSDISCIFIFMSE